MANKYWKKWIKYVLISIILLSRTYADFTTECQRPCDCRWQSGNKAAICFNSTLKTIPANLSSDIQILDLSNNNLRLLHQEAFKKVGLSNLKKLFLRDCNIETVHKAAFATLAIMIELDLSKNKIRSIHPDTFKGTEKLRLINLSNNLIDKLEDGLFRNLKFLQKVEASNNRIVRIGIRAFVNLPQLKILRFDGNNLSHMKPETLISLSNLSSLDLHNNPWRCDCNLQNFRNWVISHNLYTPPTSCAAPPVVRDKLWNELDSSNFACRPTILEPLSDATVKSYEENVTLTCKVVGNPTPEVAWKFNSRTIEPRAFGELRYVLSDNTIDLIRWMNLTILNARYSDRGNYTCIAENPGGRDEKSLILVLSKYGGSGLLIGMDSDSFAILVGCLAAIIFIFGTILTVCYCMARKTDNKRLIKPDTNSTNGDALMEGSVGSELEKGFITEVNPISKPPRKFEAPESLTSEATEMSELNRTLLDSNSVIASNEDNSHLPELENLQKFSQDNVLIGKLTQEYQAYPPDLLTFPLRGSTQISPATSGTSSGQERPKSTLTNGDSPIKSPGTIGRFQTPKTSQGSIPFTNPRGGYVTLPRKPRAPNWLPDSIRNQQAFSNINGVIPYYDNFGTKFFGQGGFYYSLNKSEIDLGPVNGKLMHSNLHIPYSNIENSADDEPAPSPAPGTPHATIPRNSLSSPNIHNQLLALQAMSMNAANQGHCRFPSKFGFPVEPRSLKVMLTPPENESKLKLSNGDMLKVNNSVNVVSGTLGRTRSAPKPPPKPRKRNINEPFQINTGETATQV